MRRLLLSLLATIPVAAAAQSRVTIYRDDWGVPHVYGETEPAGYYGLGYAMAEDQLEFVLRVVLAARGELAAAFGPSEVASDWASRLWRHREEAEAGFSRMSPALQTNYRAWIAGLGKWMAEHPERTPAWAPKLTPADPVAISRWLLWLAYQAGEGLADCRRGGVTLASHELDQLERRTVMASNEWALAPWRTADSALIMLSDPHGGVDGSFVFEFRLHAGELEMAGYTMGAMPLLIQNRRVAWGMTTGAPDVADCYQIAVDARDPRRFLYDGKPVRIETRPVRIEVKGAAPVIRTAEYSRHNGVLSPVVARAAGKAWVVSTPYMHDAGTFDEELYRMARAKSTADVKAAMRLLGMFPQNVMAGDAAGNILYVRAGKTPRRPAGHDWSRPVSGNVAATAWLGIHPLEDLVIVENPASGYLQNNNIAPDRMMIGSPATADRYPGYVFNDRPGRTNSRGTRAVEVLSAATRFTVADAVDLALDEKWQGTERWQAAFRRSLDRAPAAIRGWGARERTLAGRILAFDGQARAGSAEALAFWSWREAMSALPGGLPREVLDPAVPVDSLPETALGRLRDGVDSAAAVMTRSWGGIDRTLGDVFRIGRGGASSWPVGGVALLTRDRSQCGALASWGDACVYTLRAFIPGTRPDSLGRRHAEIGSRLLRLTVFTDPIQSFTVHNFGQSGDPRSPHYDDQAAKLTSLRRLKPVYFEKAELLRHVASERTLEVPLFR